jgi:hypothetical protein
MSSPRLFPNLRVFRFFHPRKAHIFGVGTGKSETHTLAELWGTVLRSAHEPASKFQLDLYLKWYSNQLNDQELCNHLVALDRK